MQSSPTEKISPFQLLILLLSVYILFELAISSFFHLPEETMLLLDIIDDFICLFFLYDFIVRFRKAPDKKAFMKWGWVDLLSSIPMLDIFRAGRILRLLRLLRVLRAFRSTKILLRHLYRNKPKGALGTAGAIAILMVIFASISILQVENDAESNIKTAEDALWWAYTTITTVGYGDRFPVTTEGRAIAVLLMTAGVGLFGTFAGYVASWLMVEPKDNEPPTAT
jgi:voltage-gated potassium channel